MNYNKFRKSNLTIFLFGLFFSSLLSYPFPNHLNGKDSFVMASISQSIIDNGSCNYLISVFSYMGLYPKSYSVGPQMYAASFSILSNFNIESTTGFYTVLVFFIAFSSSFFVGHYFSRRTIGGLFTAILYVTAPIMTGFLGNWNFSTRVLILTFSPLIILLFLKYLRENDRRFLFLSFLILALSLTFHRTAYFFIILVVVYFLSLFFKNTISRAKIESFLKNNKMGFFYLSSLIIFLLYISPILFGRYFYTHGERLVDNPSFVVINNDSPMAVFVNLVANYTMSFGLCTTFILFGYISLSKIFLRSSMHTFVFIFIIFSGFIWVELVYARPFLIILLSILSSSGIIFLITHLEPYAKKSTLYVFFVSFIIISQVTPLIVVVNDTTKEIDTTIHTEEQINNLRILSNDSPPETIDASNYLRIHKGDSRLFSNYNQVEIQVRTFSLMEPMGNTYRVEEYESYTPAINRTNIFKIFLGEKIELGITGGPDYPKIKYSVLYNDPNTSDLYYSKALEYNVGSSDDYLLLTILPSKDRIPWHPDSSFFLIKAQEDNYKIYENDLLSFTHLRIN